MALKESFKQAVAAKENIKVRVMLKDSMLIDPTLISFEEMLAYAEERIKPFYDKHNGEELIHDSANWTEQYLDKQMVAMITNFSVERISLLRKMVPKICGNKKFFDRTERSNTTTNNNKQNRKIYGDQSYQGKAVVSKSDIGTGFIVVGSIAFVAGVLIPKTVLTVTGVGAIAVGAAFVIQDKKEAK